jgi:hypothetical protein
MKREAFKKILKDNKITIEEFCSLIGVHRASFSNNKEMPEYYINAATILIEKKEAEKKLLESEKKLIESNSKVMELLKEIDTLEKNK